MAHQPRVRGYTLVALTIAITIMMIMIAAVLPLASTQIQREREEELVFRGRQYAEAIRCFRRKYGRYPTTLREMLDTKPRTLRKLWKDPITNSDDWGLVTMATLTPLPGQPRPVGSGSTDGGTFGGSGSGFGGGFGKVNPTPTPASPDPFGGRGGSTSGGDSPFGKPGGETPLMPVMGVYSKSTKKSFRVWQGRDTYDSWKFTEQTLMQNGDTPGVQGGPMGPGSNMPGMGNPIPPGGGRKP